MSGGVDAGSTAITVDGDRPYQVRVGRGVSQDLPDVLGNGVTRAALIHSPVMSQTAAALAQTLPAEVEAHLLEVPDAEQAKQVDVAQQCWDRLGEAGFTRNDVVVGIGGGAVTDLAGFVGACWLRGVGVVLVPTTLLGMVDAAVGGKTGVNTAAGKNLVGAFHPPRAVLCDLGLLASLPARDYLPGLAEVVKAGFIADPTILQLIESDPAAATRWDAPVVESLVARAIAVKAEVVAADLTESAKSGLSREILNYGHTLGHAIERHEHYRWRHGDAVAVGMVFAAALGRRGGLLDDTTAARHASVLSSLGLPVSYDCAAWPELHESMRVDKKARGSRLRFVVLGGLAQPRILADPDPELLQAAYRDVCGESGRASRATGS